ncbi:MAG: adenylate kinase family protein [Candidatus Nanoarchaeia archaeon]|nr:adenylate kinase family protein [Candidatus Nanoarchaeia archaeon]MDD5239307.1 adenylate kinase family protein [Candidatus Nanoarchaeia archaeon]
MLIIVTGVPGTGKSEVSKALSKLLKAKLIVLKEIAVKRGLVSGYDEERSAIIINERKISSALRKEMKDNGTYIFETHLGHYVDKNIVKLLVILRCNPKVLEQRLKKRGYSPNKISENTMCEYLDTILIEALKNGFKNKIHEIDTSRKQPEQVAKEIAEVFKGKKPKVYGKISWLK